MSNEQPSVLIYTQDDILGDALLKLPALSTLRQAFPKHHITWMAGCGPSIYKKQLAPLITGMVDKIEDNVGLGCSWKELWRPSPVKQDYSVIIDSQTVVRSTIALKRIKHDLFVSPAARFLFSDRRPDKDQPYIGSIRNRLLELIRLASGKQVSMESFKPALSKECRALAAQLLPTGPVYIGFAPGAGGKEKCWPLDRYIEVAKQQAAKNRVPVFFVGPEELDWIPVIRLALPQARFPETETQQEKGPLFCMALGERVTLNVANDSGVGHILSLSERPLISLFGRTSAEKFVDQKDKRQVLRASQFGGNTISSIPVKAVTEAIEELCGHKHRD